MHLKQNVLANGSPLPDPRLLGEIMTLHHANPLALSLTPEIRCCRCPYVGASPQTFDVRTATERRHKSMHYRPLQTTSFDTAHFSHLILPMIELWLVARFASQASLQFHAAESRVTTVFFAPFSIPSSLLPSPPSVLPFSQLFLSSSYPSHALFPIHPSLTGFPSSSSRVLPRKFIFLKVLCWKMSFNVFWRAGGRPRTKRPSFWRPMLWCVRPTLRGREALYSFWMRRLNSQVTCLKLDKYV